VTVYLDASAAAKLLVDEAESATLAAYLDDLDPDAGPLSSALLETELRRLAMRLDLPQWPVTEVLARVTLVEPQRSTFHAAGLLPVRDLRSLDALHLATALRIEAVVVVGYDRRLLNAARALGLETSSPT
jgi:predicted nucleic acid-binding protein